LKVDLGQKALRSLSALAESVRRGEPAARFDERFDELAADFLRLSGAERARLSAEVSTLRWMEPGVGLAKPPSYYARFRDERQPQDLRRALLLEAMCDGSPDPRDTDAEGIDVRPILREVAKVSSPTRRLGMPSMRGLLRMRWRRFTFRRVAAAIARVWG
jgi:hypothetical protein